jgi:FlaA1/EpsC-like NDP-sugar epimerase
MLILVGIDAVLAACAFWLAVVIRLGRLPDMPSHYFIFATVIVMVLMAAIGLTISLYRPVVHLHIPQLSVRAGVAGGLAGVVMGAIARLGGAPELHAIGLGVVFALVLFTLLVWSRHAARWLLGTGRLVEGMPVAIYGAGTAGRQLAALLRKGQDFKPSLFIDDDPLLHGRMVEDLPVIHAQHSKLPSRLRTRGVKEILLAIPSLGPSRRREILEVLSRLPSPIRVRTVPILNDIVSGRRRGLNELREISAEDLLGRDPVEPLPGLLEKCIKEKVVLVTGGGGSIGSELCRQVLALQPKHLVALDNSEFALYQIEQELSALHSKGKMHSRLDFVLGSVTEASVVNLLRLFRVDTVYHAAAYKHVPLVESNAAEGLRNNVLGTWHLARASERAGVSHFILISSDKAVRPTNVMGATKRMAELVTQMMAQRQSRTVFSMVRFGNVLDSSGSVVPLFRRQIARGGPITLTHPEVTRYFMTIPEAVQLVIQAGAMATGGEVYVLDMGEPVKIADLARKMVQLSGHLLRDSSNPHGDIGIEVVGLRPGEKLYEELLISGEATGTTHPRICRVREDDVDHASLDAELRQLEVSFHNQPGQIDSRRILAKWVTGYSDQPLPNPSLQLVNLGERVA